MKRQFFLLLAILGISSILLSCGKGTAADNNFPSEIKKPVTPKPNKVVVAYVTSWTSAIPDAKLVTHINYAFGHVTDNFRAVRIDGPDRLRRMAALKRDNPDLKVLLSIGGWGSGRFSEMAADAANRKSFADDCLRVINEYKLDGVDIDWEYPTSSSAGISSSPNDTKNYTLLMAEIRKSIGDEKLLTLASSVGADYIDFAAINPYVDFVNIMGYDISGGTQHHSGLYRSSMSGYLSVDEGVTKHVAKGFPINKLVLGLPFYGHGKKGTVAEYIDYKEIVKLTGFTEKWDDVAKASYLTTASGEFVCTFDSPRAIAEKCLYIKNKNMLGAMYWDYAGDTDDGVLRKAVFDGLNGK